MKTFRMKKDLAIVLAVLLVVVVVVLCITLRQKSVAERLVRQINSLPPYGETCTAVFLCAKVCRETR